MVFTSGCICLIPLTTACIFHFFLISYPYSPILLWLSSLGHVFYIVMIFEIVFFVGFVIGTKFFAWSFFFPTIQNYELANWCLIFMDFSELGF